MARGRASQLNAPAAQANQDVVNGTSLINNSYASIFFDSDAIGFEERSSSDRDGVASSGNRHRMADQRAGVGGGAARRVFTGLLDVERLAGSEPGREGEHQQRDAERDTRET